MTREFKIGDFVRYTLDLGGQDLPSEGYVIGYTANPFDPDSDEVHPVVATEAWHSENADPEQLTLLSSGHTETAHRLREQYQNHPLIRLLPIPEGAARP